MKLHWPTPTLLRLKINGKSEGELRPLDLQVDGSARSPIRGRQPGGASREMPGRMGPSFEDLEHFRGASARNPPSVVDVLRKRWMRMSKLIRHCSGTQAILVHQGHRTPEGVDV